METNTETKLEFNDELYGMLLIYFGNKFFVFFINDFFYLDIKLYCPVILNIGAIVCISDPKHGKKMDEIVFLVGLKC